MSREKLFPVRRRGFTMTLNTPARLLIVRVGLFGSRIRARTPFVTLDNKS